MMGTFAHQLVDVKSMRMIVRVSRLEETPRGVASPCSFILSHQKPPPYLATSQTDGPDPDTAVIS
jgi:hypothetical protein